MAENPTLDTTATIDALRARVAALEADIAAWNLCADHQPDRWLPPDGVCTLCEARYEQVRARALEAERDAAVEQCASAERELNLAWQALDAIAAGPPGDDSYTPQGHREAVEAARAAQVEKGDNRGCPFGYAADQCCGCARCQSHGWQWVRISDQMVEMLSGEDCGPVLIRVEPRPGNEVELIATHAPAHPHAEALRALEEVRDDYRARLDAWFTPALNAPTKDDVLDAIGHAYAAIDAQLAALRAEGEGDR